MGKAFYKGGFEKQMTRREAALILETSYVFPSPSHELQQRGCLVCFGQMDTMLTGEF